jgi:hypothetical protein
MNTNPACGHEVAAPIEGTELEAAAMMEHHTKSG